MDHTKLHVWQKLLKYHKFQEQTLEVEIAYLWKEYIYPIDKSYRARIDSWDGEKFEDDNNYYYLIN